MESLAFLLYLFSKDANRETNGTEKGPESVPYHEVFTQKEETCLATNMFYEARGEGQKGMELVGHTTLNRMESDLFPDDICKVVYQPKQFSWTIGRGKNASPPRSSDELYKQASAIAENLLKTQYLGKRKDSSKGALYFYNPHLANPRWARTKRVTVSHRNHTFML